jgi:hypothetical protein
MPLVLPLVWAKKGVWNGGMNGDAVCFAVGLG